MKLRLLAVLLSLLSLPGCGGISEAQIQFAREHYGKVIAQYDPLCISRTQRFPRSAGDFCMDCARLLDFELIKRAQYKFEPGFVLTAEGQSLYRETADGRAEFCFAKSEFHSVAEVLAPMEINAEKYQSFKIVLALTDINELLYDPRYIEITKGCNTKPEPGKPALCAPRIATFARYPNGEVELRNDMSYGKWINEK
jgi:hypothetical protein